MKRLCGTVPLRCRTFLNIAATIINKKGAVSIGRDASQSSVDLFGGVLENDEDDDAALSFVRPDQFGPDPVAGREPDLWDDQAVVSDSSTVSD